MNDPHNCFENIQKAAKTYNVIPVYRELIADMETPVSAFLKVSRDKSVCFLLESVEGGEKVARYSFIGIDPFMRFRASGDEYRIDGIMKEKAKGNPIEKLKEMIGQFRSFHPHTLPRFSCGAVGYFGYDAIRYYEDIPETVEDIEKINEIDFGFYRTLLVFDNSRHKLLLIANIITTLPGNLKEKYDEALAQLDALEEKIKSRAPLKKIAIRQGEHKMSDNRVQSNFEKADFMKNVDRIREYIRAGDAFQVVFSQQFSLETKADPFDIYRCLRIVNPSPYMYFLKLEDRYVVGASPEMLVRIEDGEIEVRPIAGTRPRGKTPEEDDKLEKELLQDEKELAEHIMLVDLGRNDVGRVSEPGTVKPEDLKVIERYSHVMHIVSNVKGKLKKDISPLDALFSCFPAGTLSGAPKIRAMEIIDELEPTKRGIYGGALGYIDFSGNLDTCIVIRTMFMDGTRASVQAGAGIVADSDPATEFEESRNKAMALFKSIEMAENLMGEEG